MQVKDCIKIKNAYVVYNYKNPNKYVGLKNFTYDFKSNKIYCIIGESGSGKSTLISLFNGLNRLNYGDIELCSIPLNSKKDISDLFIAYKIIDNEQVNKIKKAQKYFGDFNKYFILLQVAKNANDNDIKSKLLALTNNKNSKYLRITKNELDELNIKDVDNHFILVNHDNIDDFKLVKKLNNDENFKTSNISIKKDLKKLPKKIKNYKELRKQIGMVSQFPEFQLFKSTVLEDVAFGLRTLGEKKNIAIQKAKEELNKLGIYESHFNNSPFALSGGQKRRVAIAGILAIQGNTLVFDEPTAGLDPIGEKEMVDIMLNAKKEGKNVFVVTHSMDQVLQIADEILVIHKGRLFASGTPYEIFNNQDVLKSTNVKAPYVINLVNELIKKDKKWKSILKYEPRTVEELADAILKIKGAKNV